MLGECYLLLCGDRRLYQNRAARRLPCNSHSKCSLARGCAWGAFTNRGNLPPSDAASEGKSTNRGWATAVPSPTQRPAPIHECPRVLGAHLWLGSKFNLTQRRGERREYKSAAFLVAAHPPAIVNAPTHYRCHASEASKALGRASVRCCSAQQVDAADKQPMLPCVNAPGCVHAWTKHRAGGDTALIYLSERCNICCERIMLLPVEEQEGALLSTVNAPSSVFSRQRHCA